MKYLSSFLLCLAVSLSAYAQQRSQGVEYFVIGENDLAKEALTKEINTSPAEAYYFLGEIALKKGNIADAKANYEKAANADSNSPYPAIGLSKLAYKSNPKDEDKTLSNIVRRNKKDILVVLEVARAYAYNGNKEKALEIAEDAQKTDVRSPWPYILRGDLYAEEPNMGQAAGQYDQAIYFDPNNVVAYIKNAKIYEHINKETATNMLLKVEEVRPDYAISNKYAGDLFLRTQKYAQAAKAYEKYFKGGAYTVDDIKNYAASEYFSDNYEKAKALIEEGLDRDSGNFVLNRLLMYIQEKTGDSVTGLAQANKFFSLPTDSVSQFIAFDHLSYATLLRQNGEKAKAVEQIHKAIEKDSTQVGSLLAISDSYAAERLHAEAGSLRKLYIENAPLNTLKVTDYFDLGRNYFNAGSQLAKDSTDMAKELTAEYIKEADDAFAKVAELAPTSYLGYYWRARALSVIDPELKDGLAKPYYEEAITILEASEDPNARILSTAYQYLAVYYTYRYDSTESVEDKNQAILYAEKTLAVTPEDATARNIIGALNQ